MLIPQQQNAKGALHNIDFGWFRCVLGDRFCGSWEPDPGFDGFRQVLRFQETGFRTPRFRVQKVACPRVRRLRCSMGSDGLGSVPWTELVLGTGFRKPEVLRRFRVPTIPFPRFRKLLSTLKGHFCTLKAMIAYFVNWKYTIESIVVYFESTFESIFLCSGSILLYFKSILLYFESMLLYFESMLLYFESVLLYFERIVLYFEFILLYLVWKYTFLFWKYTFVLWKYTLVRW